MLQADKMWRTEFNLLNDEPTQILGHLVWVFHELLYLIQGHFEAFVAGKRRRNSMELDNPLSVPLRIKPPWKCDGNCNEKCNGWKICKKFPKKTREEKMGLLKRLDDLIERREGGK